MAFDLTPITTTVAPGSLTTQDPLASGEDDAEAGDDSDESADDDDDDNDDGAAIGVHGGGRRRRPVAMDKSEYGCVSL